MTFFRLTSGRAVPTHPSEHAGRSRKSLQAPLRGGNHDDSPPSPHSSTYTPSSVSLLWAPPPAPVSPYVIITHLSDGRFFAFHKRVVVDRVFYVSSSTLPISTTRIIVPSYVLRSSSHCAQTHGRTSRGEARRVMLCYVLVSGFVVTSPCVRRSDACLTCVLRREEPKQGGLCVFEGP